MSNILDRDGNCRCSEAPKPHAPHIVADQPIEIARRLYASCSFCGGSGIVHGEGCVACAGRGAQESEFRRLTVKLAKAIDALRLLRRMATDPMNSWDSGRVIDAQRVNEICEDALEIVGE